MKPTESYKRVQTYPSAYLIAEFEKTLSNQITHPSNRELNFYLFALESELCSRLRCSRNELDKILGRY